MKNRYLNRAHIPEQKFKKISEYFCLDFSATQTSQITGIGRKNVNRIFNQIRYRILDLTEKEEKLRWSCFEWVQALQNLPFKE